jgi:hypothetical protein
VFAPAISPSPRPRPVLEQENVPVTGTAEILGEFRQRADDGPHPGAGADPATMPETRRRSRTALAMSASAPPIQQQCRRCSRSAGGSGRQPDALNPAGPSRVTDALRTQGTVVAASEDGIPPQRFGCLRVSLDLHRLAPGRRAGTRCPRTGIPDADLRDPWRRNVSEAVKIS